MLLLVLSLVATDPAVAPEASPPALRHGPIVDDGPAPAWQYFGVAGGLSLASSVLLAPALLLLPLATTLSVVALAVGPPAVAVVGAVRLEGGANVVSGDGANVVTGVTGGVVVVDVVGVVVGGVVGYLAWDAFGGGDLGDSVYSTIAIAAAFLYGGSAVARAVGSGVGAVAGHLLSPAATED